MSTSPIFQESQDLPSPRPESDVRSLRLAVNDNLSGPGSYKDLVLQFRREKPDIYANALEHLDEAYCLGEEDMEGYSYAFYTLLFCANGRAEFLRLLRTDDNLLPLLRKSVTKALLKVTGREADQSQIDFVFEKVQENLNGKFSTMRTFLQRYNLQIRNLTVKARETVIPRRRQEAVQQMDIKYKNFFEGLRQNGYALTDEEMSANFATRNSASSHYLSTYFDSAQFGIRNIHLTAAADEVAHTSDTGWDSYVEQMKFQATFNLEQIYGNQVSRRFRPDRASFHPNGTMAFNAFRMSCMRPGDRVLATSEEYVEMVNTMEKNGIEVKRISKLITAAAYREEIAELLRGSRFDYLLVSETSRFGTVFPLDQIHLARQVASPHTKLIIDACQSAGRVQHDLTSCRPEVVIYSTNKGSDFGQGLGVVALSSDFRIAGGRNGVRDTGLHDYEGTIYHEAMARTAFAMTPQDLPVSDDKAQFALSPKDRGEAIQSVASNCVALIREINLRYTNEGAKGSKGDDRIQIIHPKNTDQLAHAIELKVKGVPREKLCAMAKSFGVHIADYYYDAYDNESVRIAFHPWMGNEALKILGYVLDRACSSNA